MTSVPVNVDNFVRAETDRMFAAIGQQAGGINRWLHFRVPTPLDQQTVIRMNRDTLYSAVVADIRDGAVLSIPDAGERYLSVMMINQDHYINQVLHDPGEHTLDMATFESPYVLVAARTMVDPADPSDVEAVNALQDQLLLTAASAVPFSTPDYDVETFTATREAVLALAKGVGDFGGAFGRREDVSAIRHLLGTAAGWGGLPESEAYYVNVDPGFPVGAYSLTVRDVPVDAFWSISLYDAAGYFPDNGKPVSVNSLTATPNDDGSVTVHFGGSEDRPNTLPVVEGWNYLVRLYRPHSQVLDGSWTFPAATADQA